MPAFTPDRAEEPSMVDLMDLSTVATREDTYYLIIPDASGQRALLLPGENGLALPHFTKRNGEFWQSVEHVNRATFELLGVRVITLRCLALDMEPGADRAFKVYAMENRDPAWQPPAGGGWFGADGLERIVPEQRGMLAAWLDWSSSAPGPLRVPWYTPGWMDSAVAWVTEQLQTLGYGDYLEADAIEQIRAWQRSSVFRIRTRAGELYFKASPLVFKQEPLLTQWLSELFPTKAPTVVAVEPERSWMLMRAFAGETLDRITNESRFLAMARSLARLQVDTVQQVDNLLGLGLLDRCPDEITQDIDALLADTAAMLPGQPGGLTAAEIERLSELGPQLKAMLTDLEECGLPCSLEHGDFYSGQVADNGQQFTFFDWSDSSISHPFFSFSSLLDFLQETRPAFFAQHGPTLVSEYLEPWAMFTSAEQLERAVALSMPLAQLHFAVLYHRFILPWLEVKWEMERMLPFFLRRLLYYLDRQG
jgi:hypothetical protein